MTIENIEQDPQTRWCSRAVNFLSVGLGRVGRKLGTDSNAKHSLVSGERLVMRCPNRLFQKYWNPHQTVKMITLRKANERGHADHGWLKSYHTFSFASYHDRDHMNFRSLRVMNEDRVAAGQGFGTHAHADMEIVSYVLEGALEHKDSMGNGEVLHPGEFQRISAGTGITHSEFNPANKTTHFYQIWLLPKAKGIQPSYEQKKFEDSELANSLRLVASPNGRDGALSIHSDVNVYLSRLDQGKNLDVEIFAGRYAWLQVLRGAVTCNGNPMSAGDGAAIVDESKLHISALSSAEIMLFDLA